jgi:hypothetical protein
MVPVLASSFVACIFCVGIEESSTEPSNAYASAGDGRGEFATCTRACV